MHHLLENFLNHLQFERHYSSHTLLAYQTDLEQFFDFLYRHFETPSLSESMLTQVDVLTVRLWMGELLEQGMQARSIGRKLAAVRSFFRYLVRQRILSVYPLSNIKTPKVAKRLPQSLTEEQTRKLFDEQLAALDPDSFEGRRDRAILELLYSSGLRLSELIGLNIEDIDMENMLLKVFGKGKKTSHCSVREFRKRCTKKVL